jgi:hypothetical protein
MTFTEPPKFCGKCGHEIPPNGGPQKKGLIACQDCAIAALPILPTAKPKLGSGETVEGQMSIEAPSLFIS